MKKTLTLLAVTASLATAVQAQSFTNPGLETWHSFSCAGMTMETADSWINYDTLFAPTMKLLIPTATFKPMVSKETVIVKSGAAAVRLETRQQDDTSHLYLGVFGNGLLRYMMSAPGKPLKVIGGAPVSGRIESVSAWLNCAPAKPNDMGYLLAFAIKTGIAANGGDSVVGQGAVTQPGTSGAWVHRECFINYDDADIVPDPILVQLQSSATFAGVVPADGSVLYADDLTMKAEPTGIETPLFTGETISVYPNPATDVLHINGDANKRFDVTVYAMTGALVMKQQFTGQTILNTASLAPGQYAYQVYESNTGAKVADGSFVKK